MGETYTFVTKSSFLGDETQKVWIPSQSEINKINKQQKQLQKIIDDNISKFIQELIDIKSQIETLNKTLQQLQNGLEETKDNCNTFRDNLVEEMSNALQKCLQNTIMKHYEMLASFCQAFPSSAKLTSTLAEIEKVSKQIEASSSEKSKKNAKTTKNSNKSIENQ